MSKKLAELSGFEVVAVVNYMGLEQPVGASLDSDGKPAFFRLEAASDDAVPQKFEIAGDATTDNHYVALAAKYGANMVRRPDPLAAKAEIIRQFGAKAVQLGVPPERESEAGANMFASMVSMSQKSHAERDRDLRRCHLPVPKRGKPDDDLVQWLDAMPASLRDSTIANNVRGYVPLYEPDPVSEGDNRASAFAKDLESLKAAILESLDGGSVLAFQDYKRFQEWFEVTHTYEQWDSEADPVNPALLHSAFGELRTAEATAISGWTRDVAVIDIASTDTAAFADLGRFVEAGRILNDVADQLSSGLPEHPVALYDTNSNMVGTFTMRADQPPQSASKEGAIQLVLNPWSIAEEGRAQEMADAIREVGVRLTQQAQDDVMFLISDTKGTTIGYVSVDAPAPVELVSSRDHDSLSL